MGSVTEDRFDSYSDIDMVVIFKTSAEASSGEKILFGRTNDFPYPVEFICVDQMTYEQRSAFGGILYTASTEGRSYSNRPPTIS